MGAGGNTLIAYWTLWNPIGHSLSARYQSRVEAHTPWVVEWGSAPEGQSVAVGIAIGLSIDNIQDQRNISISKLVMKLLRTNQPPIPPADHLQSKLKQMCSSRDINRFDKLGSRAFIFCHISMICAIGRGPCMLVAKCQSFRWKPHWSNK